MTKRDFKSAAIFATVVLIAVLYFFHKTGILTKDILNGSYPGERVRFEDVEVLSVVDGDTAWMFVDGQKIKVRFEGVDTPEVKHPEKGVQFYGPEASEYVKSRLSGKTVTLEVQVKHTREDKTCGKLNRDKYDRLLAVIWIGGEDFNLTLIQEGYARATEFKPFEYYDKYHEWEKRARDERRGLWREPALKTE